MACEISITKITGYRLNSSTDIPYRIDVEGNVKNCPSKKILVELSCIKGGKTLEIPPRTDDWSWDVIFDMPDQNTCLCDGKLIVTVTCLTEDGSIPPSEKFTIDSLDCNTLDCPEILKFSYNFGECDELGRREVVFEIEIASTGSGTIFTQLNFGDGTYSAASDSLYLFETYYYEQPGPYTVKLEFILPEGCPSIETEIPVFQPCDCPETMIDDIVVSVGEDCNSNGTRNVTLTPILNSYATPIFKYRWEFSGGLDPIEVFPPSTPGITKEFPAPGDTEIEYTVTFIVLRPDGCIDIKNKSIVIEGCQAKCPKIEDILVTPMNCVNGNNRIMTLDASINGGGMVKYTWNFGDGDSEEINAITEDARTTHEYSAPGNYTVSLTIHGPGDCIDTKQREINVQKCEEEIKGCMDPEALNYNPNATIPGPCEYKNGPPGWRSLCCWLIYGWLVTFISIWFTTDYWPALVSALGTSFTLLIAWYIRCCCGYKFWKGKFWKCLNPFKNCLFLKWTLLGHKLSLLFLGWAIAVEIYTPPAWVWAALASGLAFWEWRFYASGCTDQPIALDPSTWPPCKCKKK